MTNLIVMIGIVGSGKSSYAQRYLSDKVILSSDKIREEIFGSASIQKDNNLIFSTLYRRMVENLIAGNDVVIDATNISLKFRREIFKNLLGVNCYKKAIVMGTPIEVCKERNKARERVVPEYVIEKQYKSFQFPFLFEGFDEISIIPYSKEYASSHLKEIKGDTINYSQGTPYHRYTLDIHQAKCGEYIPLTNDNVPLLSAAFVHDVGKPFCRTMDENGVSHYYGHANIGAYELMVCYHEDLEDNLKDVCEILFYVNYHMLPYDWKEKKTKEKYRNIFGDYLFDNLMILNKADMLATGKYD